MRVVAAQFLRSGKGPEEGAGWPEEGPPEVAFAGRSNVGKSTLLNALLGRKNLVRVSRTPGRTRLINFFQVEILPDGARRAVTLRFVDLPGFGYAKVSKEERATWRPFVERYLGNRPALKACALLVDARRVDEPDGLFDEVELGRWMTGRGIDVIVVMTKADKLRKHERRPAAERLRRLLGPAPIVVSATSGEGIDTLWGRLTVALRL
jgi:GTP-binding protein